MRCRPVLLFVLTVSLLSVLIFSSGAQAGAVQVLTPHEYFPTVKHLIESARTSIDMVMFEATHYADHPRSPSNRLVQALIDAHRRGVSVTVILDRRKESDRNTISNRGSGALLQRAGVTVIYDDPRTTTHAKLLFIDDRIVVLGSTNWTYPGLMKNNEIDVVIDSVDTAAKIREYIRGLKKN